MDITKRGRERRNRLSNIKDVGDVDDNFSMKNINELDDNDEFDFDFIRELEDDDESGFYEELHRLTTEGALAFQAIKGLYTEHPYALNNEERFKKDIEKIEIILKDIENLYEP